jgi:hypothetical protein
MRPSGRLDVSTEELETLLERARQEPLEPDGYEKLKAAIRTLGYVTELLENREATPRDTTAIVMSIQHGEDE